MILTTTLFVLHFKGLGQCKNIDLSVKLLVFKFVLNQRKSYIFRFVVQFLFVPQINGGISHGVIYKRLFTRVPDLDEAWSISRYGQQRFHLVIFGWSKIKIEILHFRKKRSNISRTFNIHFYICYLCCRFSYIHGTHCCSLEDIHSDLQQTFGCNCFHNNIYNHPAIKKNPKDIFYEF